MLPHIFFRKKSDFCRAPLNIPLQNSVTLTEEIRNFTKSCKNPKLFDLLIGLKIGFLKQFLDYKMQNFK